MKTERTMAHLRKKIDRADQDLVRALAARFAAVEDIGALKLAQGLPLEQKARWSEVMRSRVSMGKAEGLRARFVRDLYSLIHEEALLVQHNLQKKTRARKP